MKKQRLLPQRPLRELFALAREIGEQNVLLNDAEYGAVLAGDDKTAFAPQSVANMRSNGRLRSNVIRVGKQPRTRLSDALAEVRRMTDKREAA